MIRHIAVAALALASPLAGVAAKVIPGPGMPTLAEAGLTDEMLANETFVDSVVAPIARRSLEYLAGSSAPAEIAARGFDPKCFKDRLGTHRAALACMAYLSSLGTNYCEGHVGTPNVLATSEEDGVETTVAALSLVPRVARSYCRDVAVGVAWVANNCKVACREDDEELCGVAGSAPAEGNGDLVIQVSGSFAP